MLCKKRKMKILSKTKKSMFVMMSIILLSACEKEIDVLETNKVLKKETGSINSVSKIVKPTINLDEIVNKMKESEESFEDKIEENEGNNINEQDIVGEVNDEINTNKSINEQDIVDEGNDKIYTNKSINEQDVFEDEYKKNSDVLNENDEVRVFDFDMYVGEDDRVFHKNIQIDTSQWIYGMTPCEWIYVEPELQLISNYKPNSSTNFSVNKKVSSGLKGCFVPIFCKTDMMGDDYDGRIYCFDDYSKVEPEDMLFANSLNKLQYRGYSVEEILQKAYNVVKLPNGLLIINGAYVNVIYATDLDKILDEKQ